MPGRQGPSFFERVFGGNALVAVVKILLMVLIGWGLGEFVWMAIHIDEDPETPWDAALREMDEGPEEEPMKTRWRAGELLELLKMAEQGRPGDHRQRLEKLDGRLVRVEGYFREIEDKFGERYWLIVGEEKWVKSEELPGGDKHVRVEYLSGTHLLGGAVRAEIEGKVDVLLDEKLRDVETGSIFVMKSGRVVGVRTRVSP